MSSFNPEFSTALFGLSPRELKYLDKEFGYANGSQMIVSDHPMSGSEDTVQSYPVKKEQNCPVQSLVPSEIHLFPRSPGNPFGHSEGSTSTYHSVLNPSGCPSYDVGDGTILLAPVMYTGQPPPSVLAIDLDTDMKADGGRSAGGPDGSAGTSQELLSTIDSLNEQLDALKCRDASSVKAVAKLGSENTTLRMQLHFVTIANANLVDDKDRLLKANIKLQSDLRILTDESEAVRQECHDRARQLDQRTREIARLNAALREWGDYGHAMDDLDF
ncbi:hypothetical protein IAU60_005654 [Kwoniella sp. DSM 27419]